MGQLPTPDASQFRIVIRSKVSDAAWGLSPFHDLKTVWQRVGEIFTAYAGGTGSLFSSAGAYFMWEPVAASTLNPWEPVVYLVDSHRQSVIGPRFKMAIDPTATGGTFVGGALNLSEVYLLHDYHDTPETFANTIVHELMHNKLNSGDAMHNLAPFSGDIGGFMQAQLPHNTSLSPTRADISAMAPALSSVIPQQIGV